MPRSHIRRVAMGLPAALVFSSALSGAQAAPPPKTPAALIHRAVATQGGYDANAWWIETPEGVVLIDALMLRSDARALVAAIRSTGKDLRAVLITHAHADHFGGLSQVRAAFPGVPVVSTRATADGMRTVHEQGLTPNGWLRALGEEYEHTLVTPTQIAQSGDTLRFAGLMFIIRDYGAVESDNNSAIFVPTLKAVFTGDLTVHGASFYTGGADARLALTALPKLRADHPGDVTAYAGHYGPRPLGRTVEDNLAQVCRLLAVTALVGSTPSNRTATGDLTADAKRQLLQLTAMQTAERSDYGVGAVGMARFLVPGLVASFVADSARKTPAITQAVRGAMRPLLFLVGRYDIGDITVGPGGLYIDGQVVGAGGYRYHVSFSYDHVQSRYRVVSRDETSGLIDVFEGTRDAAGTLTVSNVEPGTHYLDQGAKVFNRMQFVPRADGSWLWRVETGRGDGVWTQGLEQAMVRRPLP